jgi:U3 small nucleolar RNA-associated protein 20
MPEFTIYFRPHSTPSSLPEISSVLPHLQSSLLSHSRALRLNTLRLLSCCQRDESSPSLSEVVKRCLQGEEASLDVQGVRERVLRIGRLSLMVKDGDKEGAEVSIRWLIG